MHALKKLEQYSRDVRMGLQRFLGDEGMYLECVQEFQKDDGFAVLGQAIQKKDYKKVLEVSHNLKGAAGNLGLTPIYILLSDLVMQVREKKYESLKKQYHLVIKEQKRLKQYI